MFVDELNEMNWIKFFQKKQPTQSLTESEGPCENARFVDQYVQYLQRLCQNYQLFRLAKMKLDVQLATDEQAQNLFTQFYLIYNLVNSIIQAYNVTPSQAISRNCDNSPRILKLSYSTSTSSSSTTPWPSTLISPTPSSSCSTTSRRLPTQSLSSSSSNWSSKNTPSSP